MSCIYISRILVGLRFAVVMCFVLKCWKLNVIIRNEFYKIKFHFTGILIPLVNQYKNYFDNAKLRQIFVKKLIYLI